MLISFSGCTKIQVVSTTKDDPEDKSLTPSLKKIEFQGDLKNKIRVAGIRQGFVNENLLAVQLRLENLTNEEIYLNYKFEWLDGEQFIIKDSSIVWSAILARAGDTVLVRSVATSSKAKNFNLKIQRAKNP